MLLRFGTILIILFAHSVGQHAKCGMHEAHEEYLARGAQMRTDFQTSILSPAGLFMVHYDTTGSNQPPIDDEDGSGIYDYVEIAAIMADSTWFALTDAMGYDIPPLDGDGIYDIYLRDDLPQGWYGVTRYEGGGVSYMEIDNDFAESYFSTHGIVAMKVTVVHEFFHAIQYGYSDATSFNNRFFYEMSSTWLEDVLVPEVNDYLTLRYPFFNDPERTISSTDGYSIALFGHYLSWRFEPTENQQETTIIRRMWEYFGNTGTNATQAMKVIINGQYDSDLIDAWTDFIGRKMLSGIEPEFYYYEDQALIDPITTATQTVSEPITIIPLLEDDTANVQSFRIGSGGADVEQAILAVAYDHAFFNGGIATIGSVNSWTQLPLTTIPETFLTDVLDINNKVVLVLGSVFDNTQLTLDIETFYAALPPTAGEALAREGRVEMFWGASPGPWNELLYQIYRNDIYLGATVDTFFVDTMIDPQMDYAYTVTADNGIGESAASDPMTVTTWPADAAVTRSRLINVYPNPLPLQSGTRLVIELDAKQDYSTPRVELFDLRGRQVFSKNLPAFSQGRQIIQVPDLNHFGLSSGYYVLQVRYNDNILHTRNIALIQ